MPVTITYWDLRGLAETHRLMLEYLGVEYQMEYITSRDQWMEDKYKMGIDFPNLPVYDDGEVRMSQSIAIMRYIAQKYKTLNPETEDETRRAEIAEGVMVDIRIGWGALCYNPNFAKIKDQFLKDLPDKLRGLEDVLGKRQWVAGGKLTYVDFGINESLDHIVTLFPGCYDNLPNIKKYKFAFDSLPKIKAYRASNRFKKFPINGPSASWGGSA